MTVSPRPPFDPELAEALAAANADLPPTVSLEMVAGLRVSNHQNANHLLEKTDVITAEHRILSFDGTSIDVTVFRRSHQTEPGPVVLAIHGGGMVIGDRFGVAGDAIRMAERYGAIVASIEYRLAPEHPDPVPVEDCYAGLVWLSEHARDLGGDPTRLLLWGASAGGGLAAGTALLSRDRNGPPLIGQMLLQPMLDDRNDTVSAHQFSGVGVWDRASNEMGWTALLGERRGSAQVSCYASPARADDLSGLPPTFIDVGSAEVFRDEVVAFASQIWASGGDAELHVWPGGWHNFSNSAPDATVSRRSVHTAEQWLDRHLGVLP